MSLWMQQQPVKGKEKSVMSDEKRVKSKPPQSVASPLFLLPFSFFLLTAFPLLPTPHSRSADAHGGSLLPATAQTDSRKVEADRLFQRGIEQYQTSQFEAALQSWQQALQLYRQIKDRQGEGQSLGNLGLAYFSLGKYPKAIDYQQQRLGIARQIKDRQGEGQSLGNLGLAYHALGNYGRAIDYHQQALAILRQIKDRRSEGAALSNLGNTYTALGDYPKAIDYYQQWLAIAREIKDRRGEGQSLGNLGLAYFSLGDYSKAVDYQQQALAILRQIKDRLDEGAVLGNLGNAYDALGDYPKAIDYYQQWLAIAREIKDRLGEGAALGNLGNAYRALGNYAKAIEYQEQSLTIAQQIKDRRGEGQSLGNLGDTLFKSGKLVEAELSLLAAIQVYESLRQGLSNINKVSIADVQSNPYKTLQQVLVAQNKPAAALEIAERGRARAFVDLLAKRAAVNGQRSTVSEQLTIQPLTLPQIQQVAKAQNATLVEYSQVYDGQLFIWVVKPTGEVTFRKVDLKPLEQQNTSLTKLVAAARCLGNPFCEVKVASSRSGKRQGGLVAEVEVVYNPTATDRSQGKPPNRPTQNPHLQRLHQLLIAPIADLLPTNPNDRVIFLPQGSLFLLPFAALQDAQGQYLIQQHTIVMAPSIQVLGLTHRQRSAVSGQPSAVLVVGNPTMPKVTLQIGQPPVQLIDLPGAEREALAIAKLFNTQAITGFQATESTVVRQMPNARIIHLATHGLLDDFTGLGVPGAIALAPDPSQRGSKGGDGLLTADEILALNLKAELVVLSACDTGQGKITGDGVIGLSRSLMTVGVPSVIVSLWAVPDAPTAVLMTEFYKNLQKSPDKAQALRQAMLQTIKDHPNPQNWAAFILLGEAE